jgi:hypothetical protein
MKYLLIAFVFLTTINLNAQDNFSLTEGEVTWQKVYETEKTKEELIASFKNTGIFKAFKVEEDIIRATLKPQKINKEDKNIVGTLPPPLTVKANYSGTVFIDLKEGKYRVSFKEILIIGNGELIKKGEKQAFEQHYVNKDGKAFRISFSKKSSRIYNAAFSQTFKIATLKTDKW